jgi:hypothetical protein
VLASAPGRRICHTCLVHLTSLDYEEVRKATTALRVTAGFSVEVGLDCQICGKLRVTIGYRAPLDTAQPPS